MKGYMVTDVYSLESNVLKMSSKLGEAVLEHLDLPVWVGGCLKWVTGLSRETTSDEVVYALLLQTGAPGLPPDVPGHALHHRAAGLERPLRGRTKIIKAWEALGGEQDGACFILRKVEVSSFNSKALPPCEMVRPRRFKKPCSVSRSVPNLVHPHDRLNTPVPPPPHSHHDLHPQGLPPLPPPIPQRITRGPAHYGLPRAHPLPQPEDSSQSAKEHFKLWKMIVEQERRIQDQMARMKETDIQIDTYETRVHLGRVKENGVNYVQEAYLRERGEDGSVCGSNEVSEPEALLLRSDRICAELSTESPDESLYFDLCQSVLQLENNLQSEKDRIESLSKTILEESCVVSENVSVADNSFTSNSDNGYQSLPEDHAQGELQTLKKELNRSISTSLAQEEQFALVDRILQDYEKEMSKKNALLLSLLEEVEQEETQNKVDNTLGFGTDISIIPSTPASKEDLGIMKDQNKQLLGMYSDSNASQDLLEPAFAKDKGPSRILPQVSSLSVDCFNKQAQHLGIHWAQDLTSLRDHDALSEDSDTGLSSLHSGDECPTLLETLV